MVDVTNTRTPSPAAMVAGILQATDDDDSASITQTRCGTRDRMGCAEVTVNKVVPVILPDVADMVVLPAVAAVANPPGVIEATAMSVEFHDAVLVRSCLVPSV